MKASVREPERAGDVRVTILYLVAAAFFTYLMLFSSGLRK